MNRCVLVFLSVFLFVSSAIAAICSNPKATVKSFSTQDATILTHLAHIGDITLKCDNAVKPNLFAQFSCGKIIPVARIGDGKYQISWVEDIKKGSSGNVVVRLFDEEGYANIRKIQHDGGSVSSVKSLVDITIGTKSAYKGPWIKAEILAAFIVGGIAYFAFTTKGKVQA